MRRLRQRIRPVVMRLDAGATKYNVYLNEFWPAGASAERVPVDCSTMRPDNRLVTPVRA